MASFSKFKEEVAEEKVPHLEDQLCIKTFSPHFKVDNYMYSCILQVKIF